MPTEKTLGYAGYAFIGSSPMVSGVQVLLTSANIGTQNTVSYLEPYDISPTSVSRSRVKHADGTSVKQGSIAFDVTEAAMALFSTSAMLQRRYKFDVLVNDGENTETRSDCYLTSLSLSGSAGGIVSADISYLATNSSTPSSTASFILRTSTQEPLGYWWSGNTDVRDWTLTMNQNVEPVYGNENVTTPKYLKVGMVDYSLSVVTYDAVQTHSTIQIRTSSFTITGNTASTGYDFSGVTDLGMYSHSFESAASIGFGTGGSDGTVIA